MTSFPRVHDRENGRHGTVTAATRALISVTWDTGHDSTYTAAAVDRAVTAGRWLFTIPEPQ